MESHLSNKPNQASTASPIKNLQLIDAALHVRTNKTKSLATGVEVRASFDSLKEVTEYLLQMNQEVVQVILDCKEDSWKSEEWFVLVEEYFENNLKILDFLLALEKCLSARDNQLLIHKRIQQLVDGDEAEGNETRAKTLEVLKDIADPFTDEIFQIFQSVYRQQMSMLERLQSKNNLDRKLKSIGVWRKVSGIIFAISFTAVLICPVVAAAISAPPVAAALAAATSIPLGSMGRWIDTRLKNYECSIKGQKGIIGCMNVATYVTMKNLANIRVLVDKLDDKIEPLLQSVDFSTNQDAMKDAVKDINEELVVFMKNIEELTVQTNSCSRDIKRARTIVLQRIMKHPNL